jgi:hypothetical protein
VKDFFSEEQPKNYGDMYKNFAVLIENVNSKLLRKLDAKDAAKNPDTTSKKTDAESSLSLHRYPYVAPFFGNTQPSSTFQSIHQSKFTLLLFCIFGVIPLIIDCWK